MKTYRHGQATGKGTLDEKNGIKWGTGRLTLRETIHPEVCGAKTSAAVGDMSSETTEDGIDDSRPESRRRLNLYSVERVEGWCLKPLAR